MRNSFCIVWDVFANEQVYIINECLEGLAVGSQINWGGDLLAMGLLVVCIGLAVGSNYPTIACITSSLAYSMPGCHWCVGVVFDRNSVFVL